MTKTERVEKMLDGKSKRLKLNKTIIIPADSILYEAPKRVLLSKDHYELTIGIGKDETARLIIHEDALKALKDIESTVTFL